MNAAFENLRVKQCGMLLSYSSSRHPAVTPGQTRAALLQVGPPSPLPLGCCPSCAHMDSRLQSALHSLYIVAQKTLCLSQRQVSSWSAAHKQIHNTDVACPYFAVYHMVHKQHPCPWNPFNHHCKNIWKFTINVEVFTLDCDQPYA